jgi:hypothetical protein
MCHGTFFFFMAFLCVSQQATRGVQKHHKTFWGKPSHVKAPGFGQKPKGAEKKKRKA